MTEATADGPIAVTDPDDLRHATFPRLLAGLARTRPDDVALQEKHYGIWQPITFAEYHGRVRDFAHGLAVHGVKAGDLIAVIGDNRPEWLIAELAAQSIGAAVVGIYPTSVGEEIVHILTHGGVEVVVAEDQEQVDKLLVLLPELPQVRRIVYYDPRGLEHYDQPILSEFTSVEAEGRVEGDRRPGWLDEQMARGSAEDVAVICTTSGTTSAPKLAELSHHNLLSMGQRLMQLDPLTADDRFVSFLPFAWIGEQMIAAAAGLQVGFTISFPEEAGTVREDMREIGPNVMFSPPRIWESMVSDIQVRLGEAGWLKRTLFAWGYEVGREAAEVRVRGGSLSGWQRSRHLMADLVALRPIRDQLGLSRLRRCYTGGAPLGPDVFRFFHSIGVNLKQIYGQTEICGIAVAHSDDDVKFNTVGRPIPGTEIQIAENGEILLRSDAVFLGYYNNEEETRKAIDADGWLHTGDAGQLDEDGHLIVIDRAKDVMRTADGTMFSPAFIENKLKFSPFVEEAVVFLSEGEVNEISAIVTIDGATVGTWAEQHRLSYTTYTDLSGKSEVYDLVADEVATANEDLPESIRVRRFVILHKPFDPDDDEITRTRKVRRNVIEERYATIIDALTSGTQSSVEITSRVAYQDGTSVDRHLSLAIRDMSDHVAPPRTRRRVEWSTV